MLINCLLTTAVLKLLPWPSRSETHCL